MEENPGRSGPGGVGDGMQDDAAVERSFEELLWGFGEMLDETLSNFDDTEDRRSELQVR